MASKKSKDRKIVLAKELEELFDEYQKLFVVTVDNVTSNQLHEIRKSMRGTAVIYCGKNTQMRRVIRNLEETRPELEKVRQACKLNVALVFTNGNLAEVRDMILDNKKPSPAKAGAIAQVDVIIEKGVTTLEPSMTSFLQALNIGSNITKGSIEIINDIHLLHEGVKVDPSQAALLQKLDIMPFAYGLVPIGVFDGQAMFAPEILDISDEQILGAFSGALREITALSLELEKPCMASVTYSIMLAFMNMMALAAETDVTFEKAEPMKAFLKDGTM
jgi:large subunit ribosomal protein LP0